ncbi:MAG: hypothetical protein QG575_2111 [Euryarchaeota archaeon]|nr:hypothetical protein [Euryarchaeota archaeon]
MTDRAKELEAAAKDINPVSLQAAKDAIVVNCREYLRWADLFSRRLETIKPEELHKFVRAFSLTLLGHLPTRPSTCPFCIQYDRDRACTGCGYAATHGRCDADDSAFSLFIEAFQELGRVIYQDTEGVSADSVLAERRLCYTLRVSTGRTMRMMEEIKECSALQLMDKKARYIGEMIGLLPCDLLCSEVEERMHMVNDMLKNYW